MYRSFHQHLKASEKGSAIIRDVISDTCDATSRRQQFGCMDEAISRMAFSVLGCEPVNGRIYTELYRKVPIDRSGLYIFYI
jgi:hypothetical protein